MFKVFCSGERALRLGSERGFFFFVARWVASLATTATGEVSLSPCSPRERSRVAKIVENGPTASRCHGIQIIDSITYKTSNRTCAMSPGLQFSTFVGASNYTSVASGGFNTCRSLQPPSASDILDEAPLRAHVSLWEVWFIFR